MPMLDVHRGVLLQMSQLHRYVLYIICIDGSKIALHAHSEGPNIEVHITEITLHCQYMIHTSVAVLALIWS